MSEEFTPSKSKYLFTTTDAIGLSVGLKEATFSKKILPKHGELDADGIKDCVEAPHIIRKDSEDEARRIYNKYVMNPIEGKDNMINAKVVVEQTPNEYDEVVTGFIRRRIGSEETTWGDILYDASKANRSRIR